MSTDMGHLRYFLQIFCKNAITDMKKVSLIKISLDTNKVNNLKSRL